MEEKQLKTLRDRIKVLTGIIILLVAALCFVSVYKLNEKPAELPATEEPLALPPANLATSGTAALSLWTDEAKLKSELTEYMAAITNPESPDFIPVENRIAVFDLDGTLVCETDPIYFDHRLFMHRVQEDPTYTATEFDLEVAAKVQEFIDTGNYPSDLDNLHGQGIAESFAGMTIEEFNDYVEDYKNQPMPSYDGMTNGQAFYQPMVQVIDYLQANEFTVYIVSGTDRLIVRQLIKGSPLNIPPRQIIGSNETIVAKGQGDTDGLSYLYAPDDELVLAGNFELKNLKMNKVTAIQQEIGVQPVLSFGNSTGDSSMAQYVIHNNQYKALAYMLCCDDLERENGNTAKADKMYELCEENGWTPISMKNDWTTIYGEGVTYKGQQNNQ